MKDYTLDLIERKNFKFYPQEHFLLQEGKFFLYGGRTSLPKDIQVTGGSGLAVIYSANEISIIVTSENDIGDEVRRFPNKHKFFTFTRANRSFTSRELAMLKYFLTTWFRSNETLPVKGQISHPKEIEQELDLASLDYQRFLSMFIRVKDKLQYTSTIPLSSPTPKKGIDKNQPTLFDAMPDASVEEIASNNNMSYFDYKDDLSGVENPDMLYAFARRNSLPEDLPTLEQEYYKQNHKK